MIGAGIAGAGGQDDSNGGSKRMDKMEAVNIGKDKANVQGKESMMVPGDGSIHPAMRYNSNGSMASKNAYKNLKDADRCACNAADETEGMIR